jgi:hypothetical protein
MAGRNSVVVLAAGILLFALPAKADLTISSKPTQNVSCSGGVCVATDKKAVLNVDELTAMLGSGDATVSTGGIAKDIDVTAALGWASTSRLTLDADKSLIVKQPVTVAGTGALTISTNGGHQKVDLEFFGKGSVQFWDLSSSLVINGKSYTLVGDIATLAADIATNASGSYALAHDYDASADGTYKSSPIPTSLEGTVDGLGNSISKLAIDSIGFGATGLFTLITPGGTVRNLGIVHASAYGNNYISFGLLAGDADGLISRCWATGTMRAARGDDAGGLAGFNSGVIFEAYADVKLSVRSSIAQNIGGLVGRNIGTISTAHSLGSVKAGQTQADLVGGLVGLNQGLVENTFARNSMLASNNQCCSVYFGGLVGKNDSGGQIQTSYAAGQIGKNDSSILGGLVGFDGSAPGNISNSYWDLDLGVSDPSQGAGNVANDSGISGLTTAQFLSGLPAGFDPKIWRQESKTNAGFPFLLDFP